MAMQDSIRRQKAGMISPLTAINYLRDLLDAHMLEQSTGEHLLRILRRSLPFYGSCKYAFPVVSRRLDAEVPPPALCLLPLSMYRSGAKY
jgi:hypothetical protein